MGARAGQFFRAPVGSADAPACFGILWRPWNIPRAAWLAPIYSRPESRHTQYFCFADAVCMQRLYGYQFAVGMT